MNNYLTCQTFEQLLNGQLFCKIHQIKNASSQSHATFRCRMNNIQSWTRDSTHKHTQFPLTILNIWLSNLFLYSSISAFHHLYVNTIFNPYYSWYAGDIFQPQRWTFQKADWVKTIGFNYHHSCYKRVCLYICCVKHNIVKSTTNHWNQLHYSHF